MKAPPYATARVDVVRIPDGAADDVVAVEEPLEIRIGGVPAAVTMRTPGHDVELALGFALSEGLSPRGARLPDDLAANTVELDAPGADLSRLRRHFYTSSSCGVCGKGALEAVAVEAPRVESDLRVSRELVLALPDRLREAQAAFEVTGGLHASGLFAEDGDVLCVREDVGRHNALDKLFGAMLRSSTPIRDGFVVITSRASYEMVQKAAVCGVEILAAVSRPTGLAVRFAQQTGVTLAALLRGRTANVYANPQRIS